MKNNDQLKKIDIKNPKGYYSDEIMRAGDYDFNNMVLKDIMQLKIGLDKSKKCIIYTINHNFGRIRIDS